ncbi:MAG: DUF58 domain-containing protein [Candidatus Helarchaeota archaeon]|nr:DUF58 domain-containing protein [Candidatus Helarchaeota archaeon]
MLTNRGRVFVLAGIFFLFWGSAFTNYYLAILGIALLFMAVVSYPGFQASVQMKDIVIKRILDKSKTFVDDFVHIKIQIQNKGSSTIEYLEVHDIFPGEGAFKIVLGENQIGTRIDPRSTLTFSYILQPKQRGEFRLGPCRVIIKDRAGFIFEEKQLDEYTTLLVYPTYEDVRRMKSFASRRREGMMYGAHRTRQKGMGSEFYGIRQYISGDEYRRIDWKASARSGGLMIREFESEKNIRVMIFLDASSSMISGSKYDNKLEYSIRAALLLTHLALERRDQVGLIVYSDRLHYYIEPKGSEGQFFRVLEVLARVEGSGKKNLYGAVDYVVKRMKKDSFFFILTDMEETSQYFLQALMLARSYDNEIILITPFGPFFEAGPKLKTADLALLEAISEELWERRTDLRKQIGKMEINAIDVSPQDYFPTVITEYLNAKKKGGKGLI